MFQHSDKQLTQNICMLQTYSNGDLYRKEKQKYVQQIFELCSSFVKKNWML